MNHVGSYQTKISVPSSWSGRRIFLCFEGVGSAFHLWIDGTPVGYSQDSRLDAEFDVSKVCKPGGEHIMSLRVYRFCDGSYLEDQDMWWISGVHRDVIMYSKPANAHIWDVCAHTDVQIPTGTRKGLSEAPASIKVDVCVCSYKHKSSEIPSECSVSASLYGPHRLQAGDTHADPPQGTETVFSNLAANFVPGQGEEPFEGGQQALARVDTSVGPVRLWSPEEPWLYTLVVSLVSGSGSVKDVEVSRVGFRKVVCEGNKFVVNGGVPYMMGVNRSA